MPLSNQQKKYFRQLGHKLNAVVTVSGKGLTDTVTAEIDRALEDHELIKVKVIADDREMKAGIMQALCENAGAELVQSIGNIALVYRAAKKPNPKLSNLIQ